MIVDHLGGLEQRLTTSTTDAAGASQALMREFCEPLFGAELQIGAGRIVDSGSKPDSPCPAVDILFNMAHGPRLPLADGLGDCFLAEAVVATITVVPTLDFAAMSRAVASARAIKMLRRTGLRRPGNDATGSQTGNGDAAAPVASDASLAIPCYLVAFDGPAKMEAVHIWLKQAYREQEIAEVDMPSSGSERQQIASPALDGVFVLGRGFLGFDNSPLSLFDDATRRDSQGACWSIANSKQGSLITLYLQLQLAATAMAGTRLDPRPYVKWMMIDSVRLGN